MHSLRVSLTTLCLLFLLKIVNSSSFPELQQVNPLQVPGYINNNNNLLINNGQPQPMQQQQLVFDPLNANNVQPIQAIDPTYFKNSFKKSKPNKVSSLLHYFHGLSNDSVYDPKQVENVQQILNQPDFKKMSDEEVLKYLCSEKWTSICEKTVRIAIDKKPQHVADIVQAIRNKPAYVNANKLLWHKLFEKAITKVENSNYDEKLNSTINTIATKNPYLFAASKIIDKAV